MAAAARVNSIFSSSLLIFAIIVSLSFPSEADDDEKLCVYTVYVRTGSIWKGGTDSIIGLTVGDAAGENVTVADLQAWGGLMGPDRNYYERGNLDIFSGRASCLSGPPCRAVLTSDGSGAHHGWYCNYVEVTSTGPHVPCSQKLFTIEQWLARDASPYELTAVRDYCPSPAPAVAVGAQPRVSY